MDVRLCIENGPDAKLVELGTHPTPGNLGAVVATLAQALEGAGLEAEAILVVRVAVPSE